MYHFLLYKIQRTLKNSVTRIFLLVVLSMSITACTATRERGEEIFRSQHSVTVAIIEAIQIAEMENPEIVDELYAAGDELNEACESLQETGFLKFMGKAAGFFLKLMSFFSFDNCEEKTKEVEELIWRLDPETARYYLSREAKTN